MSDVHSVRVRSYNMSRIKSKNTKPELVVRKLLHSAGFRFRLHASDLPGKPDIVLRKYETVVFVHGCFWHGHEKCKYFVVPPGRVRSGGFRRSTGTRSWMQSTPKSLEIWVGRWLKYMSAS